MPITRIRVSHDFEKQLRKMHTRVRRALAERELIFRENPFDRRLSAHRLHRKDSMIWVFSVTQSHRIKFIFIPGGEVIFLEIGTHAIYK